MPKRSYRVKTAGEVESLRAKYNLNKESFLFDELAEPLRDRLILTMADIKKTRNHVYDREGRLIRGLEDKIRTDNISQFSNNVPNLNIGLLNKHKRLMFVLLSHFFTPLCAALIGSMIFGIRRASIIT